MTNKYQNFDNIFTKCFFFDSKRGLVKYAAENEIKLKSHGDPCCDPYHMTSRVNEMISSRGWTTSFVARYSQMSKDRFCITKKGFTAQFRIYNSDIINQNN